ncbi:hypothetical protein FIU85_01395 [Roseovarius sp. THAF8]|uniref:hypothetical protein n=1 Tax=Roseovarius sp. THAF8 TaxID=2587846 RepID=UPI0012695857|nr:hypothetical protein [Roseovarius sp. THAF8]QFT95947.1 hypothetical protein FIU85_01395 [Roseovarius sp. THAF8]
MANHDTFLDLVRGSQVIAERWAAICEKVISDAAERGVQIEPEQVLDIREARLAALGNGGGKMDADNYLAELEALPALHESALARRIAEGDAEARSAAVSQVNRGKDDVHPDRWASSASRRISKARELGIATAPAEPDTASRAERLEMLSEIEDAGTRLSMARKWGLV